MEEIATLGGGCFWCTEAVFNELKGVLKVEPGYSGGWINNPRYEQVCKGTTGHAEVVQITFDSNIISFGEILKVFFSSHDPTSLNRQGADVGTQYRSVIFYHNKSQKSISENLIEKLIKNSNRKKSIVTQLAPFKKFFIAEEYHKNYFKFHPNSAYCTCIIKPKIKKIQKYFPEKLK
jgi:peptide-methionine (S)-S-oxide reductase